MNGNETPAVTGGGQDVRQRAGNSSHVHGSIFRAGCQAGIAMFTSAGRCVAEVQGDTLTKTVSGARHFLRQPPAIAFDENILSNARRVGAVRIEVTDSDSGAVYHASLDAFDRHGLNVSRGYGPQRALPLAFWHVQRPGDAVQLSLFAAVAERDIKKQ